jgi:hypothetical protein
MIMVKENYLTARAKGGNDTGLVAIQKGAGQPRARALNLAVLGQTFGDPIKLNLL